MLAVDLAPVRTLDAEAIVVDIEGKSRTLPGVCRGVEFGVEPVGRHLPIAPQTYYAAKGRPPSKRSVADEVTAGKIHGIHASNYGVYGVRKVHAQLRRDGEHVAPCTVERLMKREGLRGVRRAKGPRMHDNINAANMRDHKPSSLTGQELELDRLSITRTPIPEKVKVWVR